MIRTVRVLAVVLALLGLGCGSSTPEAKPQADGGQCHDLFTVNPDGSSPAVPCCPDPAPDCSTLADGYPGYKCAEQSNQFCSCLCSQHMWQCAC